MNGSQKILLKAGFVLAIVGMSYGFWYAVADEHPTLERMGVALASAFAGVADGDMQAAQDSLETYGATRFEYVREVHAHGHVVALSTLLVLLGLFFSQLALRERTRQVLAWMLVIGSAALPLGALLEIWAGGALGTIVAAVGAFAVIAGMAGVAFGLLYVQPGTAD